MKISELIKHLQEMEDVHGDIEVYGVDQEYGDYEITRVDFFEPHIIGRGLSWEREIPMKVVLQ